MVFVFLYHIPSTCMLIGWMLQILALFIGLPNVFTGSHRHYDGLGSSEIEQRSRSDSKVPPLNSSKEDYV